MRTQLLTSLAERLGLTIAEAIFLGAVIDKIAEIGGISFNEVLRIARIDREMAAEIVAICRRAVAADVERDDSLVAETVLHLAR